MFFLAVPGSLALEDPRRGKAHFEREILFIIIYTTGYDFMLLTEILTLNASMMFVIQRCLVLLISEINIFILKSIGVPLTYLFEVYNFESLAFQKPF